MDPFPWQLVTVDIDGTLTRGHGWRPIAEAVGRLPEYERSNRRFFAHEIGEDEHLADLLGLATGHTVREVEEIVERTPKLAGIREGVDRLHTLGARVALLTHNPPYVIAVYRREFGFDDAEGIDAPTSEGGRIGPPIAVHADKRGGLARLLERSGAPAHRTVHVGDGWSDAELFPKVGAGVALNSRLPEVRSAADLVLAADDFRVVVDALRELPPGR